MGSCPYGHKCQFAHGVEELRVREDQPSSYKTKACRSFARTGRCPYGPRCRFMHGDVVEAQQLAAMRITDERPYTSGDVRVLEGSLKPTASAGTSRRCSCSSTDSEGQPDLGSQALPPRTPHAMPMTPPQSLVLPQTSTGQCSYDAAHSSEPRSPPHAVLLPYAQLPHADPLKLPNARYQQPWGNPPPLPLLEPASSTSASLVQKSPPGCTPTSLASPASSLLPSAQPSTHASTLPSPAMLPLPPGASPAATQLGPLPPALLPQAPAPAPAHAGLQPFASMLQNPAMESSELRVATYGSGGSCGMKGDVGGLGATVASTTSSTSSRPFASMVPPFDCRESSSTFMQHSIAKQLSVLFDDGGEDPRPGSFATGSAACGSSTADLKDELSVLDASADMLADKLAAVCCSSSMPRQCDGSVGIISSAPSRW